MYTKLTQSFYDRDTLIVARELIGKYIVVKNHLGDEFIGRITETEAYIGLIDKACHAYHKRTPRNDIMFGSAGFAYVYLIYGMYHCLNFVTEKANSPCAVLIRAIEPIKGVDRMCLNRFGLKYNELPRNKKQTISNGPGKLCDAMGINMDYNKQSLIKNSFYVASMADSYIPKIETSKRIGIDYAEEAKDFLWRFIDVKSKNISKKP